MSLRMPETHTSPRSESPQVVLALTVNNHPGVMSHICGLFARRAFNVEGILCMPIGSGAQSRIWLRVPAYHSLGQMIRKFSELQDMFTVQSYGAGREVLVC